MGQENEPHQATQREGTFIPVPPTIEEAWISHMEGASLPAEEALLALLQSRNQVEIPAGTEVAIETPRVNALTIAKNIPEDKTSIVNDALQEGYERLAKAAVNRHNKRPTRRTGLRIVH